ncbi:uncharacterized protein LOC135943537 isoform X3 [Cloeon dipterum]|uniref:uncharacterized protein LOC135943537 isoform X3 n=1 Tax=Cloeon dipterum TaxID=197152 RepID=UPI0032209E8E
MSWCAKIRGSACDCECLFGFFSDDDAPREGSCLGTAHQRTACSPLGRILKRAATKILFKLFAESKRGTEEHQSQARQRVQIQEENRMSCTFSQHSRHFFSLFNMAEYKSRKKRSMPTPIVLFIAICVLIHIPSTKGITQISPSIEFQDHSDDHWILEFGSNSKEIKYDFCKYNATSKGALCKNYLQASVDFEKVCNCTIQHDETNEGSFFDLNCKSDLSYCPKELTLTYRQGSNATAPPQVPSRRGIGDDNNASPGNPPVQGTGADLDVATSGLNGWLLAFLISTAFNVLFVITIIACLINENFYDFLKEKLNRTINREHETDIDSPESGLSNTSLKLNWRKTLDQI